MNFEEMNLLNIQEFTDSDFVEIGITMNALLDIFEVEDIHTLDEFSDRYPDIPIYEFFEMVDLRSSNTNVMKITMKDLSPLLGLYNRITKLLKDDEDYFTFLRQKASLLFKMRKPDLGEEVMLEYIDQHPDEAEAYLELMFFFDGIAHDRESALYYGGLALSRDTLDDKEAIEDFMEDLEMYEEYLWLGLEKEFKRRF